MKADRVARLATASLVAVMLAVAGCASSVPTVRLPNKGTSYPSLGSVAPAWTPAQQRVIRAYRATQVALVEASDSRSATRAQELLAPRVLAADVPVFISGMTANWQKGDVSSGKLDYQVEGVTFKHSTALIETCWQPIAFAVKSASTGKLVSPLPRKTRHSITLMGYVRGRWLQGKSIAAPDPCD